MQRLFDYVKGKSIWLYLPVYLVFVYIFLGNLAFSYGASSNPIVNVMYFIEFGIHEASHIVTMFLPAIFVASAGSGGELLFTVLIVIAAIKYKSYFFAIFGALWVMLACKSIGAYMSDARSQLIPLIGPSNDPQHDWHFVFSQLGWLQQDTLLGGIVMVLGIVIGSLAMLAGLLLLGMMAFGPKAKAPSDKISQSPKSRISL